MHIMKAHVMVSHFHNFKYNDFIHTHTQVQVQVWTHSRFTHIKWLMPVVQGTHFGKFCFRGTKEGRSHFQLIRRLSPNKRDDNILRLYNQRLSVTKRTVGVYGSSKIWSISALKIRELMWAKGQGEVGMVREITGYTKKTEVQFSGGVVHSRGWFTSPHLHPKAHGRALTCFGYLAGDEDEHVTGI